MRRLTTMLILACLCLAGSPALLLGEEHRPEHTQYPLRAQCALNLMEAGKYLQVFALARDGMLPSRLSEAFADASDGSWRCLVCPADKLAVTQAGLRPSYAYAHIAPGGRKADDGEEDILMFDAQPVHEGGRNVLFSDMKAVRYLSEADFQKLLAEQAAKWREQGKRLEIVSEERIPLSERDRQALGREGRTGRDALYFGIVLGIVALILVVVLLLVLQSQKRRASQ